MSIHALPDGLSRCREASSLRSPREESSHGLSRSPQDDSCYGTCHDSRFADAGRGLPMQYRRQTIGNARVVPSAGYGVGCVSPCSRAARPMLVAPRSTSTSPPPQLFAAASYASPPRLGGKPYDYLHHAVRKDDVDRLYEALHKYKSDQDSLIKQLQSKFETKIQNLESSMSTSLQLIASLSTRVDSLSVSSVRTDPGSTTPREIANFSPKPSPILESRTITSSQHEQPADVPHVVAALPKDERSDSEHATSSMCSPRKPVKDRMESKLPSNCDDTIGKLVKDGPRSTSPRSTHRSMTFEQLSCILADMATSWLTGSQDEIQLDPSLVQRMEHMCEEVHRAIRVEKRDKLFPGSEPNQSTSAFHSSSLATPIAHSSGQMHGVTFTHNKPLELSLPDHKSAGTSMENPTASFPHGGVVDKYSSRPSTMMPHV